MGYSQGINHNDAVKFSVLQNVNFLGGVFAIIIKKQNLQATMALTQIRLVPPRLKLDGLS